MSVMTTGNRLDDRALPFGRERQILNKETREARYGSLLQFAVRTPYV
jgi:hypothetical protein